MFKDAKVGDRVFCYLNQSWGTIVDIKPNYTYKLRVQMDAPELAVCMYTIDGKHNSNHVVPVLFWDEVKPVETPAKPVVYPKAGELIWVSNTSADCSSNALLRFATGDKIPSNGLPNYSVEVRTAIYGCTMCYKYWKPSDIETKV